MMGGTGDQKIIWGGYGRFHYPWHVIPLESEGEEEQVQRIQANNSFSDAPTMWLFLIRIGLEKTWDRM